jgi:hypothetical protein
MGDSQNKKDFEDSGLDAPRIEGQLDIFKELEGRDEAPANADASPRSAGKRRLTVKEIVAWRLYGKEPK